MGSKKTVKCEGFFLQQGLPSRVIAKNIRKIGVKGKPFTT